MVKHVFCFCLMLFGLFSLPAAGQGQEVGSNFYTSLTQLLQRHVQQGQVNYKALRQDKEQLQRLVSQLARYDLSKANEGEKKAFYLNAYNLLVLYQVMQHYPLNSVSEVEGFFDKQRHLVAGQRITLDELEKQKLLQPFQDARIHFALVCAAKSCPPMLDKAYTPSKVEQQLQEQTQRALQNEEFVKVRPRQNKVLVSEIFKWYKDDFLQEAPSIRAYLNRYRSKPVPASYPLGYYSYNWQLNEAN